MSNEKMTDLLKRQEEDRMNLAAGVYQAWQPIKEKEDDLLKLYGGKYENAPDEVKEQVNTNRQEFFAEWGSEGKLAAIMDARHTADREKLVRQQETAQQIKNSLRDKDKDQDRGR